MQEKNARVEVKTEGTVAKGDIAVIDFKGYIDGVAFEGGEGSDYSLEIGSGSFIDNFEDQLVGAEKDEKRNISVTFPENYGKEELNGKPAVFEVTVKEIKAKEIPALDDEFAKEVSEFDSIEELKADIRKKLEDSNEAKTKREYEEAVLDAVIANAKIEIPEVMITKETDNMIKDLEMRLKYQGLDLNTYYQYTNSSEEKMREMMKESAERKVKTDLIIDKIAKTEEVTATEEEIKEKANEIAKQYGGNDLEKTVDMLVQAQGHYLKQDVVNEKVINLLVENSKAIA
jgi:trigger factor